jgi:DDE superfamily endonuclease
LLEQGINLISTDEMTGIQAIERAYPTQPMKPKRLERIEFEYIRHGTLSLIANWHIAKGQLITSSIGERRTEEDFEQHIAQTIATEPDAGWIFIVDQLNIHLSESLVRLVARLCHHEFQSKQDLKQKILNFIDYFNRTLAKPFLWKFPGFLEDN